MKGKMFFTIVALATAMNLTGAAFAGANDYVFEPVKAEVKKGDDVVVVGAPQAQGDRQARDRRGDRPDPHRHGPGRDGRDGVAAHPRAEQRARRLCVQDRSLDGRPLAAEHRRQGARRAETVVGKITFRATR